MPSQAPGPWQSSFQQTSHQSPFEAASEQTYMPMHSSHAHVHHNGGQAAHHNLVRRSKSLTAADMDSIIADIAPTGRRRSFFSTKKPKVPLDPAAPPAAVKATPRSFSGLLPSQMGASQDGADTGSKSFVVQSSRGGDADGGSSSNSKPKAGKWWSWGSSKAPPKPDAKATSAAVQGSAPVWAVDSSFHGALTDGDRSSHKQADTGLDGYADLLAGLGPRTGAQMPDGQASAAQLANQTARGSNHNRRVSWDDSILHAPDSAAILDRPENGAQQPRQGSGLSPFLADANVYNSFPEQQPSADSAASNSLSQQLESLELPESYAHTDIPPSMAAAPYSSAAGSNPYAPAPQSVAFAPDPAASNVQTHASQPSAAVANTAATAGNAPSSISQPTGAAPAAAAAGSAGLVTAGEADSLSNGPLPAAQDEKTKKGHRRGRSFTGLIPTLKTKPKRSVSELLPAEPVTPAASSSQSRPKTPDGKAGSSNSSLVQCFGMGRTLDDAAEKEEIPPGVVGLRNLGNTCFVNVALQCLRYTPHLAQSIVPDLVTLSPLPGVPPSPNATSSSPRPSAEYSPRLSSRSSREESQDLLQSGSPQHPPSGQLGYAQQQQQGSPALQHQHGQPQLMQPQLQPGAGGLSAEAVPDHLASSLDVQLAAGAGHLSSSPTPGSGHFRSGPALGPHSTQANGPGASEGLVPAQQQAGSSSHREQQQQQQQEGQAVAGNDIVSGDQAATAAAGEAVPIKQAPAVAVVRVPLKKGEIAEAFRSLVREVYTVNNSSGKDAVDPAHFLKRISQLPAGAEFCDGGQHDGHELLRLLLHSLHDDLNRIRKKPAYEEDQDVPGEAERDKANRLWGKYLERDNSPITDLFGGQLQSTVHCHKCKGKFTTYEPFWDLSLPIAKEGKSGIGAWLSSKTVPTTIQDCLQAFTGNELLQGDESFRCEVCKDKTQATKSMRLHRLPKVLLLHVKRFKYSGTSREKLTANVSFPVKGLKLDQFASSDSSPTEANANYDLYAVSNHFGSMAGGHYTAACRVALPDGREQWYNFNDTAVAKLSTSGVVTACAYILFYVRAD